MAFCSDVAGNGVLLWISKKYVVGPARDSVRGAVVAFRPGRMMLSTDGGECGHFRGLRPVPP
jgi:hypothetical protein